jgi:cobalt-precorrin-5B (C1)-methyltransferase
MDRFSAKDMGFSLSQISSGDCVAACARAAAANLIFKIGYENITINHSNGASRTYMVNRVDEHCNKSESEYMTTMEGGMPPDIRERANIHVKVSKIRDVREVSSNVHIDIRYGNLFLQGGEGIGTATIDRPGIKKGEALIEADCRRLIFDAVADVCEASDGAQLLMITVSCPEGMMIAAKQAAGQNGFAGGITIMGSYGHIPPVHMRDISNSIDAQIRAQTQQGVKSILVSPGDYCAAQIAGSLHVDLKTSINCYNFPGQAIDQAVQEHVENLLLVGNAGKLVKLAAGIMNTNSTASDARKEIFAAHTALVGGTALQAKTLMGCVTVDEMLSFLDNWGLRDRVMQSIMSEIDQSVRRRCAGRLRFGVALFSQQFGLLGVTSDTKNVLIKVSQEQYALSLRMK